ncbi:MAG: hypothetical protein IJ139_01420 [Bacteroidaceae bacterium]|nr:hypothetical protein [Bacteroidaceae bacterium]
MQGQGETMPISHQDNQADHRYWYVMIHLEPAIISRQLTSENERRTSQGLPALTHIIPFSYLKKAQADRELESKDEKTRADRRHLRDIEEHNNLRNYLHDFVFIHATEQEIADLLRTEWNRLGRLHLHHYRSHSGNPIRVEDYEMQPLITLLVSQRQRFTFTPYYEGMDPTETVRIKRGIFSNFKASVIEANYTADGINLTLGIPMFQGEVTLQLYECDAADVEIPGRMEQIYEPHFIHNIEQQLFDILRRRVMHRDTPDTRLADQQLLNTCNLFHYLKFEDTTTHNHFRALLLLCASLSKDRQTRDKLLPHITTLINNPQQPQTDEEAFILAILYEATRDGNYRIAAKHYCQTHQVDSPSLLQLMPLIKRIKTR